MSVMSFYRVDFTGVIFFFRKYIREYRFEFFYILFWRSVQQIDDGDPCGVFREHERTSARGDDRPPR